MAGPGPNCSDVIERDLDAGMVRRGEWGENGVRMVETGRWVDMVDDSCRVRGGSGWRGNDLSEIVLGLDGDERGVIDPWRSVNVEVP